MKKFNVLSLFDGISCGRVALERAGLEVGNYYASEIDEYAIKVTQKNFPTTIQLGDITKITNSDLDELGEIDIIIGGSPCQDLSNYKYYNGEVTGLDGEKSGLFYDYVRILKYIKPKYFLLENVASMDNQWKDSISEIMGVQPIMINSSLVCAAERKRLYWTNIPNVTQPKDLHIYIDDIIQNDIEHKYLPKTRLDYTNYDKTKVDKTIFKNTPTQIGNSRKFGNAVRSNGKAYTLRRVNPNGIIDENFNIRQFTPIEAERLQTLPDNYTLIEGITNKQRYEAIGNGWTVDVIAHIFSHINK